jgi:aspartyl-tRNA(Asn)/glutamyl-tRNA(Gln) amidotransferase subunit A
MNGLVNAFSQIFEDEALAEAQKCDVEADRGELRGPLHGIPMGVKDLFLTRGFVTARGSGVFRDHVPSETAPIVERALDAGAIMIGKTTATEMGWSGSSVSELYGDTRNPWNLALTSGGSSSGSGAALAARMVPLALGSDGGGSVRIPAAFCGVFAMKGSFGRIPAYPWSATEMLSHAGPMTITAEDSAILFNVLKGPDPRDHLALPDDGLDYLAHRIDLRALRIGFAPTLFGYLVDPAVSTVVAEAVACLCSKFDLSVQEVHPDWRDPIDIFETLWVAGRGIAYGGYARDLHDFGAGFRGLVARSADYSLANYLMAMRRRAEFATVVHRFFEEFDILLLPTVPERPFDAHAESPPHCKGASGVLPWTAWTPFTYPFNIAGNPAASLPCGFMADGLPVGLQVVGRRHDDATVIAFCRAIEYAFPWQDIMPAIVDAGHEGEGEARPTLPAKEQTS